MACSSFASHLAKPEPSPAIMFVMSLYYQRVYGVLVYLTVFMVMVSYDMTYTLCIHAYIVASYTIVKCIWAYVQLYRIQNIANLYDVHSMQ